MMTSRFKSVIAALLVSILATTNVASALSDDLVYGLQLYGVKFNKSYDPLSKGYSLNVSFIDPQTGRPFYNNTTFDLGFANLVMESGSLSLGAKYTERGVPAVRFGLSTNGQPLDYKFETFIGAQDVVVDGSLLLDISTRVNQYGFYDVSLQASNRATITSDGWFAENKEFPDLDFDIGPINMSGNIYVDALALVTDPFFDRFGLNNPFAEFQKGLAGLNLRASPLDDLVARLESGQLLSDSELSMLISNSILASALGKQPSSDLLAKMILPDGFLEGTGTNNNTDEPVLLTSMAIPEPGMLALLAAAGAGFLVRARRRSSR